MSSIPSFISAKDLSKIIKEPLKEILKKTCTLRYKKYYLDYQKDRYMFLKPGKVILPFDVVQQVYNPNTANNNKQKNLFNLTHEVTQPDYKVIKKGTRSSIVAVMGHVNHGKTTLMDTLRGSSIARTEKHGITQTVNVAEHTLFEKQSNISSNIDHSGDSHHEEAQAKTANTHNKTVVTFLDTPGHFHFHRMRNTASELANAILLLVAADEGIQTQTIESIGCIDDVQIPTIVCVNKMDLVPQQRFDTVSTAIREYVSLDTCPILPIVAKDLDTLKPVSNLLQKVFQPIECDIYETGGVGIVLEVRRKLGQGDVFRVLVYHGMIRKGDHFICGMTHGVIRALHSMDGEEIIPEEEGGATPGRVVDVMFAQRKSNKKIQDVPIETEFYAMQEEDIAKQIIHERFAELEFHNALVSDNHMTANGEDKKEEHDDISNKIGDDDKIIHDDRRPTIVIKADCAGAIACIQDSVDEMVRVVRVGFGNITPTDLAGEHAIFGFNVEMKKKEARLAKETDVPVLLFQTIHEVVEAVEEYVAQQ